MAYAIVDMLKTIQCDTDFCNTCKAIRQVKHRFPPYQTNPKTKTCQFACRPVAAFCVYLHHNAITHLLVRIRVCPQPQPQFRIYPRYIVHFHLVQIMISFVRTSIIHHCSISATYVLSTHTLFELTEATFKHSAFMPTPLTLWLHWRVGTGTSISCPWSEAILTALLFSRAWSPCRLLDIVQAPVLPVSIVSVACCLDLDTPLNHSECSQGGSSRACCHTISKPWWRTTAKIMYTTRAINTHSKYHKITLFILCVSNMMQTYNFSLDFPLQFRMSNATWENKVRVKTHELKIHGFSACMLSDCGCWIAYITYQAVPKPDQLCCCVKVSLISSKYWTFKLGITNLYQGSNIISSFMLSEPKNTTVQVQNLRMESWFVKYVQYQLSVCIQALNCLRETTPYESDLQLEGRLVSAPPVEEDLRTVPSSNQPPSSR